MPLDTETPTDSNAAAPPSAGPVALARTSDAGAAIVWADAADRRDYRLYYRRDCWAFCPVRGEFLPALRQIPSSEKLAAVRAQQDGWQPIPVDPDVYVRRYEGRGKKSVFIPVHSTFHEVPGQGYHVRSDDTGYWAWVAKLTAEQGWTPDLMLLEQQLRVEQDSLQLATATTRPTIEAQIKAMAKALTALRKAVSK